MSFSEKIKVINNKLKQIKAQYNLGRKTVTMSVFSSENPSKFDFLTGKVALPENDLMEKSTKIKRF